MVNHLILDVAGVLATNFSPLFWQELSDRYAVPYQELVRFKKEARADLWTGSISEEAFWSRLCGAFPSIDGGEAKVVLLAHIRPLPAALKVPVWSKYATIHLLSNHRLEWIQPVLQPILPFISGITVSSLAGCCKPGPEIYELVHAGLGRRDKVWFVDDQERNFKEAKRLGWHTLSADPNGDWVRTVDSLLSL